MPDDPVGTTFDPTDTVPLVGELIDTDWGAKMANNILFNWLGSTSNVKLSFGIKAIDFSAQGNTTVITFSSDKTDGVDSFTGSGYTVFLQPAEDFGVSFGLTLFYLPITARTTTTFTVTYRFSNSGGNPFNGTLNYFWIAIGN